MTARGASTSAATIENAIGTARDDHIWIFIVEH